jgi:hypothetical protein
MIRAELGADPRARACRRDSAADDAVQEPFARGGGGGGRSASCGVEPAVTPRGRCGGCSALQRRLTGAVASDARGRCRRTRSERNGKRAAVASGGDHRDHDDPRRAVGPRRPQHASGSLWRSGAGTRPGWSPSVPPPELKAAWCRSNDVRGEAPRIRRASRSSFPRC